MLILSWIAKESLSNPVVLRLQIYHVIPFCRLWNYNLPIFSYSFYFHVKNTYTAADHQGTISSRLRSIDWILVEGITPLTTDASIQPHDDSIVGFCLHIGFSAPMATVSHRVSGGPPFPEGEPLNPTAVKLEHLLATMARFESCLDEIDQHVITLIHPPWSEWSTLWIPTLGKNGYMHANVEFNPSDIDINVTAVVFLHAGFHRFPNTTTSLPLRP